MSEKSSGNVDFLRKYEEFEYNPEPYRT